MKDADGRTHVLLMPHDLIHREIVGSDDERIGFVKDLLIDEVDWKVRFLHATQGGFLSLDERHFLIPVEAVREVAGGFLRVEVGKEKVPRRRSMLDRTRLTITLKSTKYQYSLRLDLPENTAYFLSASRYQPTRKPPHRPRSRQLRRYGAS